MLICNPRKGRATQGQRARRLRRFPVPRWSETWTAKRRGGASATTRAHAGSMAHAFPSVCLFVLCLCSVCRVRRRLRHGLRRPVPLHALRRRAGSPCLWRIGARHADKQQRLKAKTKTHINQPRTYPLPPTTPALAALALSSARCLSPLSTPFSFCFPLALMPSFVTCVIFLSA